MIEPHTAIVTADSLAAAFQRFDITHVTASEFFRLLHRQHAEVKALKGNRCERGCNSSMYVGLNPFHQLISLILF